MTSEAGKRLDRMLFKQLGFTLENMKFRKIELDEFVALLDENSGIWGEARKEGMEVETVVNLWGKARTSLIMLLMESYLPKDLFAEIKRELHKDMVDFIMAVDTPNTTESKGE